jgi:hypothetical protein
MFFFYYVSQVLTFIGDFMVIVTQTTRCEIFLQCIETNENILLSQINSKEKKGCIVLTELKNGKVTMEKWNYKLLADIYALLLNCFGWNTHNCLMIDSTEKSKNNLSDRFITLIQGHYSEQINSSEYLRKYKASIRNQKHNTLKPL